jgi:phage terminase large subunit-like protein
MTFYAKDKPKLTQKDREKYAALISEMKRRGLAVPADAYKKLLPNRPIKLDENGYHLKLSPGRTKDHRYHPTEKHKNFIADKSRFSAIFGGRGCISGDTLVDGIPIADRTSIGEVDTLFGRELASPGFLKGQDDLYLIKTKLGSQIKVTPQHRFLTLDGWKCLAELSYSSLLVSDSRFHGNVGSELWLDQIESVQFDSYGDFYDLTVPRYAHYSAAGLFHHNSGKSGAGAQKCVDKILQGESGAVLNPDMENFKISTWPELREWLPWEIVVPRHQYMKANSWSPRQPFMISFINGARVYCKGLKDPDSARGPNINWLWYDEAGRDFTGESWQIAVASVRVGNDPQCWATTTPKGKNWLYKFFVKKEIPEDALEVFKELGSDFPVSYYFASIHENKDNLDPGFYASILAAYPSGWLRRQEVNGEFVDEGGVLGDRSWFDNQIVNTLEEVGMERIKRRVRYWDLAASQKKVAGKKRDDPDETVGTLMSWDGRNKFAIEDQECGFWEWASIKQNSVRVALKDGPSVRIYFEEEPGSGGINQVAELIEHIKKECGPDYKVNGHNPRKYGDKVMRANIWFADAAQRFFWMLKGAWNEVTLEQLGSFSGDENEHDDRIDSISGARLVVAPLRLWKKIKFIKL